MLLKGMLTNNVNLLSSEPVKAEMVLNKPTHNKCMHFLNRRMGHAGFKMLEKMLSILKQMKRFLHVQNIWTALCVNR